MKANFHHGDIESLCDKACSDKICGNFNKKEKNMKILSLVSLFFFSAQAFSKTAVIEYHKRVVTCTVTETDDSRSEKTCSSGMGLSQKKTIEIKPVPFDCDISNNTKNLSAEAEGGCFYFSVEEEGSRSKFYVYVDLYKTKPSTPWIMTLLTFSPTGQDLGSVTLQDQAADFNHIFFSSGALVDPQTKREYSVGLNIISVKIED